MTVTSKGQALALRLSPLLRDPSQATSLAVYCSRLCRTQASLHRLNEARCNRELTPYEEKRDDSLEQLAQRQLRYINAFLRVEGGLHINGDPRGPALKITLPKEYRHVYDCAGGEGVCVP